MNSQTRSTIHTSSCTWLVGDRNIRQNNVQFKDCTQSQICLDLSKEVIEKAIANVNNTYCTCIKEEIVALTFQHFFIELNKMNQKNVKNCMLQNIILFYMQSLRQFLLTDDRRVVLGDVDELPIDDPQNNFVATCQSVITRI